MCLDLVLSIVYINCVCMTWIRRFTLLKMLFDFFFFFYIFKSKSVKHWRVWNSGKGFEESVLNWHVLKFDLQRKKEKITSTTMAMKSVAYSVSCISYTILMLVHFSCVFYNFPFLLLLFGLHVFKFFFSVRCQNFCYESDMKWKHIAILVFDYAVHF